MHNRRWYTVLGKRSNIQVDFASRTETLQGVFTEQTRRFKTQIMIILKMATIFSSLQHWDGQFESLIAHIRGGVKEKARCCSAQYAT